MGISDVFDEGALTRWRKAAIGPERELLEGALRLFRANPASYYALDQTELVRGTHGAHSTEAALRVLQRMKDIKAVEDRGSGCFRSSSDLLGYLNQTPVRTP